MKLSFTALLLLALLPLVLASPTKSWWDRLTFRNPSRGEEALPFSHPAPEDLPAPKEASPIEISNENYFGKPKSGRKSPAPSDEPSERNSLDASTSDNSRRKKTGDVGISVEDKKAPPVSTEKSRPREKHTHPIHFSDVPPSRLVGYGFPNPLIDVAETSASGAARNSKHAPPAPVDKPNASDGQISDNLPKEVQKPKPTIGGRLKGFLWPSKSEKSASAGQKSTHDDADSEDEESHDAPEYLDKEITENSPQKDAQSAKPSIWGRIKGFHDKIASPWRPKDSETSSTEPLIHPKHDSEPPVHPSRHSIHDVGPPVTGKKKKTWETIMHLPLHERIILFRSGSSYIFDNKSGTPYGVLQRVGEFCKCVLSGIADIPRKVHQKIAQSLRQPSAIENAKTTP